MPAAFVFEYQSLLVFLWTKTFLIEIEISDSAHHSGNPGSATEQKYEVYPSCLKYWIHHWTLLFNFFFLIARRYPEVSGIPVSKPTVICLSSLLLLNILRWSHKGQFSVLWGRAVSFGSTLLDHDSQQQNPFSDSCGDIMCQFCAELHLYPVTTL